MIKILKINSQNLRITNILELYSKKAEEIKRLLFKDVNALNKYK